MADAPLVEALDFLYTPSRDVAADTAELTAALGGRVIFAIEDGGIRVAMIEFAGAPRLLLTDHLDGDRPILVYRVADLRAARDDARAAGLDARTVARDPAGPVQLVPICRRPPDRGLRGQPAAGPAPLRGPARLLTGRPDLAGRAPAPAVRALAGRRVGGAGKRLAGTATLADGPAPPVTRGCTGAHLTRPHVDQPVAIPRDAGGLPGPSVRRALGARTGRPRSGPGRRGPGRRRPASRTRLNSKRVRRSRRGRDRRLGHRQDRRVRPRDVVGVQVAEQRRRAPDRTASRRAG